MESIYTNLILMIALLIVLVKSADVLEDAFVHIAHKLKLNIFLIGFVVLSFASSLPEISVAVSASIEEVPALSVGNLIGATIVLLSLVIGLNAIKHKSLPFKGAYSIGYLLMSLLLITSMTVVLIDKNLTRTEGLILIGLYVLVTLTVVKKVSAKHETVLRKKESGTKLFIMGLLGVVGLIISSHFLVEKAIETASALNISNSVVGLAMLGLGTNIPEITLLIRSNNTDKEKLAVGNFLGSASFNVLTLGLLALLKPHVIVNSDALIPAIVALLITVAVFLVVAKSGKEITRKEGFILILIYFLWIASEIALLLDLF